jgi:virulence factor Mce-like protein
MRRLASVLAVLLLATGFATLAGGAGDTGEQPEYSVELDNAFGLIGGADLKIAGVRAGKITDLKLNRENRAIVSFKVTKTGFGSLRTDTRCETRPQSLIGEYFIDCLPGTAPTKLKPGAVIPVERTSSTVAPDLVNNVLRRPYRERLAIIVNELGAGVAGNGRNLDDAIRRASPALRETDKVLAQLARQNQVLADLTVNADTVLADLAANKKDVGRWVQEARDTAVASAERKADIALGFRRLPGFLEELRPTMAELGATADAQAPALRNLSQSADQLERLFKNLGPFSDANRPALRALARASVTGGQAFKAATPVVQQLATFAKGTPELGKNLAMILQHLDDPKHAVENDPRAAAATGRAAPTGYTGLEALLTYAYDQTMSTNVHDANEHILKIGVIPQSSHCAAYASKARYEEVKEECDTHLGPNQPGLNFTDPTARAGDTPIRRRGAGGEAKAGVGLDTPAPSTTPGAAPVAPTPSPAPAPSTTVPKTPTLDLPPVLPGLGDPPAIKLPDAGDLGKKTTDGLSVGRGIRSGAAAAMARDDLAAGRRARDAGTSLLAYLLAG